MALSCAEQQPDVRVQAATELQCYSEPMQAIDQGDGVVDVVGCGRQARYVWTCNLAMASATQPCMWVAKKKK
jgi:hypothetical protein